MQLWNAHWNPQHAEDHSKNKATCAGCSPRTKLTRPSPAAAAAFASSQTEGSEYYKAWKPSSRKGELDFDWDREGVEAEFSRAMAQAAAETEKITVATVLDRCISAHLPPPARSPCLLLTGV